jgi:arsenate reductase-like glutaredoxin family protein
MFLEEHNISAEDFVEMVKNNPSDDEMIAAMKKLNS